MKNLFLNGLAIALLLALAGFMPPSPARAAADIKRSLWSTTPYSNIIKPTKAPLEQFSFFINGAAAEKGMVVAVKHKESLHVRFSLPHAKQTTIEIREGGQPVYSADVFYAPSYLNTIVPEGLAYIPFHTLANEAKCQGCHRFTIMPSDLTPGQETRSQVCFPCHRHDFEGKKSQHKPAAIEWRCLQCHQSEAKESPWSKELPLRFTVENASEIAPLCYTCHPKVQEQAEQLPYVHGPLGMGACNQCHDPHASTWPKLLENDPNILCATCHDMLSVLDQPVLHGVIKSKGCTACHHPHASAHPLQLSNTGNDLCLSCHQEIKRIGNNHPVQGHPVSLKAIDKKAKKDRLSCVSCHTPHASDYPNLLEEEEVMKLCTRCHDKGGK